MIIVKFEYRNDVNGCNPEETESFGEIVHKKFLCRNEQINNNNYVDRKKLIFKNNENNKSYQNINTKNDISNKNEHGEYINKTNIRTEFTEKYNIDQSRYKNNERNEIIGEYDKVLHYFQKGNNGSGI